MKIAGIDFPQSVISALRDQKLVVFVGAGVSMSPPASLPSFRDLTNKIAERTGEKLSDEESEDRFLGRLQHEKGVQVHQLAADILSNDELQPTSLHKQILQLYYPNEKAVRVVTTNFDLLFESASKSEFQADLEVYRAPALPLGRDFCGIVYIHGAVNDHHRIVLTDADFGRAYLTEGWARRFLLDLFSHFTVLFVGYSHQDTILTYLARALPPERANQRFALILKDKDLQQNKKDLQRWNNLGVTPISYPESDSDKHGGLLCGIKKLADICRQGALDWQQQIAAIAKTGPSFNEDEMARIYDVLEDPKKLHYFTKASLSPEWIDWLYGKNYYRKNYLDSLFKTDDLSKFDKDLAKCLIENYIPLYADKLFLLFGRNSNRLHPFFWKELSIKICDLSSNNSQNKEIFTRSISLLLSASPGKNYEEFFYVLFRLGETCITHNLPESLLEVFASMMSVRWKISKRLTPKHDYIQPVLSFPCHHHWLNKLWSKILKTNLDQLAIPLLERVTCHLETLHPTFLAWQQFDDPISIHRSAIEPHQKENFNRPTVDIIIDAARDCLDWLVVNKEIGAAYWTDRLITSKAPILRRLSVYTVTVRKDLSADEKIEWLLKDCRIHDPTAWHEVFHLVKQAYPKTSREQRKIFLAAVKDYRCPYEDKPEKEKWEECRHLTWFHWLHDAAPSCTETKQAFDTAKSMYPKSHPFKPLDFLPRNMIISSQSPWTTKQLLERPAAEWLPEFLEFSDFLSRTTDEKLISYTRSALKNSIKEAAKQNFKWSINLANELAKKNQWDIDLWYVLICAWEEIKMNLDETRHREILCQLQINKLYPKHHHIIAIMLHDLVDDGSPSYIYDLLNITNKIAADLWNVLDQSDTHCLQEIPIPPNCLAEYWIRALALTRKKQNAAPQVISNIFQNFSTIIEDETSVGQFGRSVLAHNLAFILTVDEKWTREKLLPFFTTPNDNKFRFVWNGFLNGFLGRKEVDPKVADLLKEPSIEAVKRIQNIWADDRINNFISYYTKMIFYYVEDPIKTWILMLLNNSNGAIRRQFASKIAICLKYLNDDQQKECWKRWLRQYWEDRLKGVPLSLDVSETKEMLEWLLHLTAVFSEAVDLAIEMRPVSLKTGEFISNLKKRKIADNHPETIAKLLIYLGEENFHSPEFDMAKELKELVDTLVQNNVLRPEIKKQLKELAAEQGWTEVS